MMNLANTVVKALTLLKDNLMDLIIGYHSNPRWSAEILFLGLGVV